VQDSCLSVALVHLHVTEHAPIVSSATGLASANPERAPSFSAGKSGLNAGALVARTSTLERESVSTEDQEVGADKLTLTAVGYCIPHPAKVEKGGEDAHFVLGSTAIGVADGVGGWCKNGINPGEYSKQLMHHTAHALRTDKSRTCVQALEYAHSRVNVPGSSTAIVARFVPLRRICHFPCASLALTAACGQGLSHSPCIRHAYKMHRSGVSSMPVL
jgi:hypothetical protein